MRSKCIVEFSMFGVRYERLVPKGTLRSFLREKRNENKQFHVYSIVIYTPLGSQLNDNQV